MNKKTILVGIVIVLGLAGTVWVVKGSRPVGSSTGSEERVLMKGASNAVIQIIEYSDFQCPACRNAQAPLISILADYPNDVQLIFRHFPLSGHVWSGIAHQAAQCAAEQGRFWSYHDRLFEEQPNWSGPKNPMETFIRFAKEENLDLDRFAGCLTDEKVKETVMKDRKMGDEANVRSTPSFFINGELVVGGVQLEVKGRQLIRKALGMPENSDADASLRDNA